ncbi:MAG TPA: arginine--tRNA ligase, partial [Solirubrobacteraceae bacterium]
MSEASTDPVGSLALAVAAAVAAVRGGDGASSVPLRLERPKHERQGDYSTNAAMLLAPALNLPPREIAGRISAAVGEQLGQDLATTEVAGPGFLNLVMSDGWHRRAVQSILDAGKAFGEGGTQTPERILLEFVSANPTGPLATSSGGRHGAYGDALARILAHHGHTVGREYYFNDAGNQIRLLGASVKARARGEPVPEGGYQGDYVRELAAQIPGAADREVEDLTQAAVELLLTEIKKTLDRYGVHFDRFFSERTLHEGSPSPLQRALAQLEQAGHIYRSEGAV